MRNAISAAAIAVGMAGCAGSSESLGVGAAAPEQGIAVLPGNFRAVVAERVRATFFDPYSIRDAAISAPIAGTSFMGRVQTVCVRANAKNRMGAYTGAKATSFTFRAGQLTATDSEYAGMTCASAIYEPFPEIEAGYTPPTARTSKR